MKFRTFGALAFFFMVCGSVTAQPPSDGPRIEIFGFTDSQTVFTDEVFLEGRIQAEEAVISVTVQDEKLDVPQGRDLYFNRVIGPLEESANLIVVAATTASGKAASRQMEFNHQPSQAIDVEHRLAVAIPDFEAVGVDEEKSLLNDLQYHFEKEIVNRGRFRVIEMDPTILTSIVRQRETKLSEESSSLNTAHDEMPLSADYVLEGHYEEHATSCLARVNIVPASQSHSAIAVVESISPTKTREAMEPMAKSLALKVEAQFPIFQLEVIDEEPLIQCTAPEGTLPRRGTEVVIYRRQPPVTTPNGRVFPGQMLLVGRSTLLNVRRDYCEVAPLEGTDEKVQLEDIVVAR